LVLYTCDPVAVSSNLLVRQGIEDQKYGLSKYSSDLIEVIVDKLEFNVKLGDSRLDVDEEPEVAVSGVYVYDNTSFSGVVTLSEPDPTKVGSGSYQVEAIEDSKYGFTDFESNSISCIWDRLKIVEGGASSSTSIPGESEVVWFRAVYEYDDEVFDSSKGGLEIAGKPAEWNSSASRWEISVTQVEEGEESYRVTGFTEEKYGLTKMNNEASEVSISWEAQEGEETGEPGGRIPGFPILSVLLGLVVVLSLFVYSRE
jgi:hypothetical protein